MAETEQSVTTVRHAIAVTQAGEGGSVLVGMAIAWGGSNKATKGKHPIREPKQASSKPIPQAKPAASSNSSNISTTISI